MRGILLCRTIWFLMEEELILELRLSLKKQKLRMLQSMVDGCARLVRMNEEMFGNMQAQYFHAMDVYAECLSLSRVQPSVLTVLDAEKALEVFICAQERMDLAEGALAMARLRLGRADLALATSGLS